MCIHSNNKINEIKANTHQRLPEGDVVEPHGAQGAADGVDPRVVGDGVVQPYLLVCVCVCVKF